MKSFYEILLKIQRNERDTNENIQTLLIQAEHVINLLFMKDFSYLVMLCSKELQRFDVLPHYAMNVCKKLKQQLQHGMESFQKGETPSAISIEKGNAVKQYTIWGNFKQNITKITDDQTYKNVRLLVPSELGLVIRSGTIYGCDKEGYKNLVKVRFKDFAKFLQSFIKELENRFEPWPEWIILCDDTFNFSSNNTTTDRKQLFLFLLNRPCGIHPLLQEEKLHLEAEYKTMLVNVEILKVKFAQVKKNNPLENLIWYELLTNKKYYSDCKNLNSFALKFLTRSLNEGTVEVEVSCMEQIESEGRPLTHENACKLNFIATNGPHPLASLSLVEDMLNSYFGKDWHFTLHNSKWFVLKVVNHHV